MCPTLRPLHYKTRNFPLATTPEQFWVDLFRPELGLIKPTKRGYSQQVLLRKFLSTLRIQPIDFDRGLIQEALLHHLSGFTKEEQETLLVTFKKWATIPSCLPPSTEPVKRVRRSARSRKARTKVA